MMERTVDDIAERAADLCAFAGDDMGSTRNEFKQVVARHVRSAIDIATRRMERSRAHELTAGCCKTVLANVVGDEYTPLPDAPLAELLEANAIVAAQPSELIEGGRVLHSHCDPRIVALYYAFEHYGRDIESMLKELGYRFGGQNENRG